MKSSIFFILLLGLIISCDEQLVQPNLPILSSESSDEPSIELPSLTGSEMPNAVYKSYGLSYTKNQFIGIGNLKDKTFSVISKESAEGNFSFDNERELRNDEYIQILIDTSQTLTIDEYRLPDDFYDNLSFEDYLGNNFDKLLNQYPLDRYRSLPVFVINKSSSYNTIVIEDGSLAMIYEAIDESGNWSPIEFKTYSWCGNSYASYDLEKGQFALFKVPKQSGDYRTKLRLKVRINNRVFYSNEVSGRINTSQFTLKEETESPASWHYTLDIENDRSLFLDE